MHLKHFNAVPQAVPDPMHPNRTVNVTRLIESGTHRHAEPDCTYDADENGWIDFPHDVAERLRKFRNRGSGWFGVGEIADAVRLGTLTEMDQPARKEPTKPSARRQARLASED